ncbi:MAG TPA: hypothetical protein VIU62_19425 [Chloroflexota bacterium]|jgi:hypothetical protein
MAHLIPIIVGVLLLGMVAVAAARMSWRSSPIMMEVLLADWRQRWLVRYRLGAALRRLHRLVPGRGADVALLVLEWLPEGKRAQRQPVRQRGNSGPSQLITVALTSGERRQTSDELIAAVAEQYMALTVAPRQARAVAPAPATAPDRLRALLTDLGGQENAAS